MGTAVRPIDADARAYDALSQHPRVADLSAITRSVMTAAVQAKRVERRSDLVAKLAGEMGLAHDQAATSFGNALDVLERGPEDDAERALACALAGHVVSMYPPHDLEEESRLAGDLLWLATGTPFDATGLIDRALGDSAEGLWTALADRVRRIDHALLPANGRGEALVGALALASSGSESATREARALVVEVRDRKLARVLGNRARGTDKDQPVAGEMAPAPRGPTATALLAVTGVLLLADAARVFGRIALAYRRPAEVTVVHDGDDPALRVRWRVQVLGRTLRDRNVVVPRAGLVRAVREVRYPRIALYAGLVSLAVGSYVGVSTFADGVRAASPSLLGTGIAIVAAGLVLDFLLFSAWPGAQGRCRLVLVPRDGSPLCVSGISTESADAILSSLVRPPGGP